MVPLSFQASPETAFGFGGQEFVLVGASAIYWPREQALLVADLHLEKASFYARHGQMLPPYDSRETLERVALAIGKTGARRVFTLGDNFHDAYGAERLEPHAAGMLHALTRTVDWIWITGNHDADARDAPGGTITEELPVSGLILRHQALRGEMRPELSGHFHPRLRLTARGRSISRPCTVISLGVASGDKIIMPAFGSLTGGMDAADPVILKAMQPAHTIDAVLPAQGKLLQFPLWRAAA